MREIVVLAPVLARPQRVLPLMASFAQAGGPCRLLFIASPEDVEEQAALRDAGADFLITGWNSEHADYARKINWGVTQTTEPWIFNAADDLHFHPGWWSQALGVAEATGKRVIGTSDLGNAEVESGLFSTHLLFARSYVEECGTLDEPGKIFSEVYDHNWIDREAVTTAVSRDEFAFAKMSVVEHLHFHWGKGPGEDATYQKGLRNFGHDRQRYLQRMTEAGLPWR